VSAPAQPWPEFIEAKGTTLRQAVEGLARSARWPASALRDGQRAQLAVLLRSAAKHVPWYDRASWTRPLLERLGDGPAAFDEAWLGVPLLSKPELREHAALLNARSVPAAHLPLGSTTTSGSTGIPVQVATTAVSRLAWFALTVREHQWRERAFDKRLGIIRARKEQRSPSGHDLPNWGPPVASLYPTGRASVIHIGLSVEVIADWLRRFDPHYLLTYPSLAAALLDTLGAGGRNPSLEEVRLMSEPVDAGLEQRLAADWGVRVADVYSANEVGNIAFRCRENRLHVQSEAVLTEILDGSGRPCGPGESGRVVVTALHNVATPLLRYDIGDYATVGETCPCARAHPVIEKVLGRVRNMARTPDGRRFWPTSLVGIRGVQPIRQFQYVQTALDTIELRLVLDRPLTADEEREVAAQAQRVLAFPYRIVVTPVATIPRGPGGKFEEFLCALPA
jgi:phenylacetate-CoA ligase